MLSVTMLGAIFSGCKNSQKLTQPDTSIYTDANEDELTNNESNKTTLSERNEELFNTYYEYFSNKNTYNDDPLLVASESDVDKTIKYLNSQQQCNFKYDGKIAE